jgi:hypothetical protein
MSGEWRVVPVSYDAGEGEVVEVSETLKIYFEGSISEEELRDRILEELRRQGAEPLYVSVSWVGVEVIPLPAVVFDVTYQYRSKGLVVEVIILAIIACILVWLGIQFVERLSELARVLSKPVVAAFGAGFLLLALFLLVSAFRGREK